ncbi:MAG: hypothetical protein HRU28_15370, partial [Rhizobiales bacterium]|nr:hypothetical protein [Hyphomicrobiales bacterium]
FNFTVRNGGELVVTNASDGSQYDVLHSIEQISFDDGAFDVSTLTNTDLGLTAPEFTAWQTGYDFG